MGAIISSTLPGVLALTAVLSWHGDARAACPSHERVNTILRFQEAKEPVRGLGTDLSTRDAECGRRRLVEKLESLDNRIVGYKAGLTNAKIQAQFGVTSPVRGVLLEKMLLPDGAEVPANFGARPRARGERGDAFRFCGPARSHADEPAQFVSGPRPDTGGRGRHRARHRFVG